MSLHPVSIVPGVPKLQVDCHASERRHLLPDLNLWKVWPDMRLVSCECPGCGTTIARPANTQSSNVDPGTDDDMVDSFGHPW